MTTTIIGTADVPTRLGTTDLVVQESDSIVTVTFNRPSKLNSLTPEIYEELS